MVDTRPPRSWSDEAIRPEAPPPRSPAVRPPGRSSAGAPAGQRIPSMRQLAALLVNGILTLPRNYRRGMFLDIWV